MPHHNLAFIHEKVNAVNTLVLIVVLYVTQNKTSRRMLHKAMALSRFGTRVPPTNLPKCHKSTMDGALKQLKEMPGPPSLPFLGNVHHLKHPDPEIGRDMTKILQIAEPFQEKYGKLVRFDIPLRGPAIWCFCPKLSEKFYRHVGARPRRPGFYALGYARSKDEFFKDNKGLLSTQGEEWEISRKKVQGPMLRPKSAVTYTDMIEAVALDFIEEKIVKLRNPKTNQMPENFLQETYRWGLESVSCFALDTRLGCLDPTLTEDSEQVKMINAVSTIFALSSDLDNSAQLWRYLPSKELNKYQKTLDIFKNIACKYIFASWNSIEARKASDISAKDEPSLLEQFFNNGVDKPTAVVMALDMMFAGIDTASHTVCFTLYHLAQNPHTQERLVSEIRDQFSGDMTAKIGRKSLDKMPYLKAVVKEALRLNSPAIGNIREIVEPMELGGYHIPAGAHVIPFHHFMMNNPEYVKDPKVFRPERWVKGDPLYEDIHPFVHLPFGHGPRMCIGRRFAERGIYILLIKILQRFRIEWHHGELGVLIKTISFPDKPMKFTFIDRK